MDVALITCRTLPEPDPDMAPLLAGFARVGIEAAPVPWDDPSVDWSAIRLALLRSCWNYPHHLDAFVTWLGHVAEHCQLWNPLPVARWNLHKGYLLDLERRGVPITPTALLPRGDPTRLADLKTRRGWDAVVIKPAVSASSYATLRVAGGDDQEAGEIHLRRLLVTRDVLVQPYLPSVESYGERALVWIDGELTHAVRKAPRFAGQGESVTTRVEIGQAEEELARTAVAAIDDPLLYARIDVAPGPDGKPALMELELLEPSLYFAAAPDALERYVGAVRQRLANR